MDQHCTRLYLRVRCRWPEVTTARRIAVILLLTSTLAQAQNQVPNLADRSLEDLMNVEVVSVSKTEQKLARTAAAAFVITQEDIRRSGATNIPDVLRMVPGVNVAQINANTWAVSVRGLNGEFSNELLVMVDGRNVYVPTFGGVFWDVVDVPLMNIEKIEVIRGPGASVWGANAVNGVINIITKNARETRGATVEAGGGNLAQGFGTAEYSGSLPKVGDYRLYTQYLNEDHSPNLTGQDGGDGWHFLQEGFRTDSTLSSRDTLMFRGDIYGGREGDPTTFLSSVTSAALEKINTQTDVSGGSLQSVWNHEYGTDSSTKVTVSYDTYERDDVLREGRKTFTADFQDDFGLGERQRLVWGAGYRYSSSHSDGDLAVSLNPANLDTQLFSGFLQDEIAIVPDRVYLTVGAKVEHNFYTGFGVMPSARVAYEPSDRRMLWAAISRAIRTPAETDAAVRLNFAGFPGPGGTPVLVGLLGNPHFKDERLTAYEAGYRTMVGKRLSIDLSLFYNDYDDQQTIEPATPFFEAAPPPAHLVLPTTYQNLMHGETHGFEISANWKLTKWWTISPGYDFERIHMHVSATSQDSTSAPETEGSDPHQQAQIRSRIDLSQSVAWDTSVYFVDRLIFQNVPSYTRLDTGLSWQWKAGISFSVFGQNLLRDHHLEFVDSSGATQSTLIKRGAYAKITWQLK
jgi:iron complex outermembrane recepter protein